MYIYNKYSQKVDIHIHAFSQKSREFDTLLPPDHVIRIRYPTNLHLQGGGGFHRLAAMRMKKKETGSKDIYINQKGTISNKRDLSHSKETYVTIMRQTKKTHICGT